MASFLKRIDSVKILNMPNFTNIPFTLDESDVSLIQKFGTNHSKQKHKKNTIKICNTCGNTEFKVKAKHCKICGSEVQNLFHV